jgi:hypothetical protein
MFLPQENEQKQWSHMILHIQRVVAAQWLWAVRLENISYKQSNNQHADQPYNNN